MSTEDVTQHDLWVRAGGGTPDFSAERYDEMLREHGLWVDFELLKQLSARPHELLNTDRDHDHDCCPWDGEVFQEARNVHHLLDMAGVPKGTGYFQNLDARTYLLLTEVLGELSDEVETVSVAPDAPAESQAALDDQRKLSEPPDDPRTGYRRNRIIEVREDAAGNLWFLAEGWSSSGESVWLHLSDEDGIWPADGEAPPAGRLWMLTPAVEVLTPS